MTAKRHKEESDSSGFAANPFGELGGLELPAGPELPEPEPEPAALGHSWSDGNARGAAAKK